MTESQSKSGFTPIPHNILEARARIWVPGEARQVLDFFDRKLFGFHKIEDEIALSQICKDTGLSKPAVCRGLKKLRVMNLIIERDNDIANTRRINRDFTTWKPLPKKTTIREKDNFCSRKSESALSSSPHTIDKPIHISIDREEAPLSEIGLVQRLWSTVKKNFPKDKEPNWETSATYIRRLVRVDGMTLEQIREIIDWTQQDEYWHAVIRSTKRLVREIRGKGYSKSRVLMEEWKERGETPTTPTPAEEEEASPDVPLSDDKVFLDWWTERFKAETGSPYTPEPETEERLVRELLNTYGLDDLLKHAENFFRRADDYTRKKGGFRISFFRRQINSVVSRVKLPPPPDTPEVLELLAKREQLNGELSALQRKLLALNGAPQAEQKPVWEKMEKYREEIAELGKQIAAARSGNGAAEPAQPPAQVVGVG